MDAVLRKNISERGYDSRVDSHSVSEPPAFSDLRTRLNNRISKYSTVQGVSLETAVRAIHDSRGLHTQITAQEG
jgi:hypothetical protein